MSHAQPVHDARCIVVQDHVADAGQVMDHGDAFELPQVHGDAHLVPVNAVEEGLKLRPLASVTSGDVLSHYGAASPGAVQPRSGLYLDDLGAHVGQELGDQRSGKDVPHVNDSVSSQSLP